MSRRDRDRAVRRGAGVLGLAAVAAVCFAAPARAYIDPSAGSYLLQLLAAGLFGALFAIKVFWNRIKDLTARLFGRKHDDADSAG